MSPADPDDVRLFEVSDVELVADDTIAVLELRPLAGDAPAWSPGAHIDLILGGGLERQYSLCGDPADASAWRIGVLREPGGRGGSEFIHTAVGVGTQLEVRGPRNHFPLVRSSRLQFIAGGIGITPLLPMLREAEATGVPWRLDYGGQSLGTMAFRSELERYGDKVRFWPQNETGLIPLAGILDELAPGTDVYCCGPEPLLNAVEQSIASNGTLSLHTERFRPRPGVLQAERRPFEIVLDYTGVRLTVPAEKSILEVVEEYGLPVPSSCREGTCGTCETYVLEGVPDHRDSFLTTEERASNEVMMICCSRAVGSSLTLDL